MSDLVSKVITYVTDFRDFFSFLFFFSPSSLLIYASSSPFFCPPFSFPLLGEGLFIFLLAASGVFDIVAKIS